MARAVIIRANGTTYVEDVTSLEEWQEIVGGYVQWVNFNDGCGVLCNEDGISLNLPRNERATHFANKRQIGWAPDDFFKGHVIVVGPLDDDGKYTDVPKELVAELLEGARQPRFFRGPM